MPNSIFFSQKDAKISEFAADCQSENFKNVQCIDSERQDQRKDSS